MHRNFVASRAAAFFVVCFAVVVLVNCQAALAVEKILLAEGLNNPESAVVGADGRIYVTITGKPDADADGRVVGHPGWQGDRHRAGDERSAWHRSQRKGILRRRQIEGVSYRRCRQAERIRRHRRLSGEAVLPQRYRSRA